MANFFTKIFGTHSSHELKKIYPIADKVEALEEQFRRNDWNSVSRSSAS